MRKLFSTLVMLVLLVGTLTLAINIPPVKSDYTWTQTIYIQADGSIQPPTAPIIRVDNMTYTLTDNIAGNVPNASSAITIQRNNITINGAGHILRGTNASTSWGILSIGISNVKIQNMEIAAFGTGIYLNSASNDILAGNIIIANNEIGIALQSSNNNSVNGNNITANIDEGILLDSYSSYNTVSGNAAVNNGVGIYLSLSSYNTVSGNNAIANQAGIMLYSSNHNIISANNAWTNVYQGIEVDGSCSENRFIWNSVSANRAYGIMFDSSSNNAIYYNNFVNNTHQVSNYNSTDYWDNGYPSGGNYWSDYNGTDSFNGAYQNFPGSDGIGDTPYVIDSNNMDHYPLMQPWSQPSHSTTSIFISPNPVVVGSLVNCVVSVFGSNPTGTVIWSTSSIGGSFSQSVCTLSNGINMTHYVDNFTGSVTIAVYYSGDPNNKPSSSSTTLIVTSHGPVYYSQNYTSVQAAINAAPSGANVIIGPGFYNESLTINKRLTIIGEKDPPVFSGGSSATYLTLLSGASGSTVTGIEITNFQEGILVDNAGNVSIYGNIMASMGSSGIVLQGSGATGNVICDNIFQDTPTPINLTASAGGNKIYGNIITSQTSLTLNIGTDGNVVYANSMSASQITLNMTNSNGNIFYHNNFQSSVQITGLAAGNNMWNDSYPSGGNYWSSYIGTDSYSGPYQDITGPDGIGDTPYHVGTNSVDNYPLMKPQNMTAGHCVAVVSVVAAKTVIGQRFTEVGAGFSDNVTVLVADKGNYIESFSVTLCVNSTCIGTQQVSGLNPSCLMVLGFAWNTSSLAYGNYTVSVYAQPVAGQTDVSGNVFTLGTVKVTIPGDINGDFKVSLADLVLLANAYGTTPATGGNPGVPHAWNPNADIDGNAVVGLSDLVIMAYYFGQHYP